MGGKGPEASANLITSTIGVRNMWGSSMYLCNPLHEKESRIIRNHVAASPGLYIFQRSIAQFRNLNTPRPPWLENTSTPKPYDAHFLKH